MAKSQRGCFVFRLIKIHTVPYLDAVLCPGGLPEHAYADGRADADEAAVEGYALAKVVGVLARKAQRAEVAEQTCVT